MASRRCRGPHLTPAYDGQLASTLDGDGQGPLIHVHVCSTTSHGNILLWHLGCLLPERWGASAGGFEEVEENVEYGEREDEFDFVKFLLTMHGLGELTGFSPTS